MKEQLLSLPANEVRTPNLPMSTALQEAHDLLLFCRTADMKESLLSVGLPADFDRQLEDRIDVARAAQSEWVTVRDRTKSTRLVELEAEAQTTRSDLIAAGRFNLRGAEAQATLSQVRAGDSADDLVQDLFDLAALFDKNAESFAKDQTMNVAEVVLGARRLAEELSAHLSEERLEPQPARTRDLRDRAFTHMDRLVSEVRAAGRYVFRRQPDVAKHFSSRYRRRTRRNAAREDGASAEARESSEDVVEEAVVGEPTYAA